MKSRIAVMLVGLWAFACATGCPRGKEVTPVHDLNELVSGYRDSQNHLQNHVPVLDDTGTFTTVSALGFIDLSNEFFQDLGTNGRRCVTCHVPTSGWTVTPQQLQRVFDATDGGMREDGLGLGAVFRALDGANSPEADVSVLKKRRAAYSLLLSRGLIRIHLPVPADAEFELVAVDDPYRHASAADLSLYRRPLPATNLKFDSTVMWDGREVVPGQTLAQELQTQASNATVIHAAGKPLSSAQRRSIEDFTMALASAQTFDREAKDLHDACAEGGPYEILRQPFYIGINDNFGDSKTGVPFSPIIFTLYAPWTYVDGRDGDARRSVARGQLLFNTKPISISGVSGINDEAAFGRPTTLAGTCGTCHNTPNGGNHSVVLPLNIGISDASRRTPDMPLYTFRNKRTHATVQLTDPGRALIDGKWAHMGRFKGPMLRNLAPRAPYFHNGSAPDLKAVIEFYDARFRIGLTATEKGDMIAFLRSL